MTITDQITSGTLPSSGMVTVSQLKKALIYYGVMQTVSDAVSAEVTNEVNVEWDNGIYFETGDPLYFFIQSTLSYSAAQMSALIQYASSQQA